MKRMLFSFLILFGFSLAPAWAVQDNQEPICDSPAVIFCDNFEARALGNGDLSRPTYKNRGWTNASSHQVTADPNGVFSGSKAFAVIYPEGANIGLGYLLGYFADGAGNPASSPNAYVRWYSKWSSNFTYSAISNKHVKIGTISAKDNHLMQRVNGTDMVTVPNGITPAFWTQGLGPNQPDSFSLFQQSNVITFNRNQWYCIEAHTRTNSNPAAFDGQVEIWVNGVQVMSYSGLNMDRTTVGAARAYNNIWMDGYRNCNIGTQVAGSNACVDQSPVNWHPLMYRWHDNFVVSTQPIGCLDGPPPPVSNPPPSDVVPPAPPRGLRISSLFGLE